MKKEGVYLNWAGVFGAHVSYWSPGDLFIRSGHCAPSVDHSLMYGPNTDDCPLSLTTKNKLADSGFQEIKSFSELARAL